jgi:hypothetical protein
MKTLNYLLKGFGFEKYKGFSTTVLNYSTFRNLLYFYRLVGYYTIRMHFEHLIGLDVLVIFVCYFDQRRPERNQSSCCKKKGTCSEVESWPDVS